jgi:hypothetical protein
MPIDLSASGARPNLCWAWLILVYCGIASMLPVWLLLQPRGYLGGFFLYLTLGGGVLGVLIGNPAIQWPAFVGFTAPRATARAVPVHHDRVRRSAAASTASCARARRASSSTASPTRTSSATAACCSKASSRCCRSRA